MSFSNAIACESQSLIRRALLAETETLKISLTPKAEEKAPIDRAWQGFIKNSTPWIARIKTDFPNSMIKHMVLSHWEFCITTKDQSFEIATDFERSLNGFFSGMELYQKNGTTLHANYYEYISDLINKKAVDDAMNHLARIYTSVPAKERADCIALIANELKKLNIALLIIIASKVRTIEQGKEVLKELSLYFFRHKERELGFNVGMTVLYILPQSSENYEDYISNMIDSVLRNPERIADGTKVAFVNKFEGEFMAGSLRFFQTPSAKAKGDLKLKRALVFLEGTAIFEAVMGHYVKMNIAQGDLSRAKEMLAYFRAREKVFPHLHLELAEALVEAKRLEEADEQLRLSPWGVQTKNLCLQIMVFYLFDSNGPKAQKTARLLKKHASPTSQIRDCLKQALKSGYNLEPVAAVAKVFEAEKKHMAFIFFDFGHFQTALELGGSFAEHVDHYLDAIEGKDHAEFLKSIFEFLLKQQNTALLEEAVKHLDKLKDGELKDKVYLFLCRAHLKDKPDHAFTYAQKIANIRLKNELLLEIHNEAKKTGNLLLAKSCIKKLVDMPEQQENLRYHLAIDYFSQKCGIAEAAKLRNQIANPAKIIVLLQLEAINRIRCPQTQKIYESVYANFKQNKDLLDSKLRQKLESSQEHLPPGLQKFVLPLLYPEAALIDELYTRGPDAEALHMAFMEKALMQKQWDLLAELRWRLKRTDQIVLYVEKEAAARLEKVIDTKKLADQRRLYREKIAELNQKDPKLELHPCMPPGDAAIKLKGNYGKKLEELNQIHKQVEEEVSQLYKSRRALSPEDLDNLKLLLDPLAPAIKMLISKGQLEKAEDLTDFLNRKEADKAFASLAKKYLDLGMPAKARVIAKKITDDDIREDVYGAN